MKKYVFEVFEEFEKAVTDEDKIAVLRNNGNHEILAILRNTFHPKIEFTVKAIPLYKPNPHPFGLAYITMTEALRRAYLFDVNHPKRPNLTKAKENQLLVQTLEDMEVKEAIIYMNMILRNLRVKGLDSNIVTKAFPELLA